MDDYLSYYLSSELQVYAVLQRANLLLYFETFMAIGGDDLNQFYEASDSEFQELMVLVGMASHPSHVRRFKLVLNEWARNQSLFQLYLPPTTDFSWVYTIVTEE